MKKILKKFSGKGLGNILEIIPVAALLIFTVFFVVYLYFGSAKVYMIDDRDYLFGMQNASVPENIRIEDPIWGIESISDKEIVQQFYEYIVSLQPANKEGSFAKSNDILYGSIYMSDGKLINFELGKGIRIDGSEYGDEEDVAELSSYLSLLKNTLYNTRNLSNIIKAQSKVRIKGKLSTEGDSKEKKLGTEQKNLLRKIILSAKPPAYFKNGWKNVLNKGKVTAGIEIYVDENSKSPEVYIVNYENGLCMVFDSYGSQSGSIMQVMADMSELNYSLGDTEGNSYFNTGDKALQTSLATQEDNEAEKDEKKERTL